jgi:hypothetical protein
MPIWVNEAKQNVEGVAVSLTSALGPTSVNGMPFCTRNGRGKSLERSGSCSSLQLQSVEVKRVKTVDASQDHL